MLQSFLTQPWADVWAEAVSVETLAEGAVNEAGMPMEVRMSFSAAKTHLHVGGSEMPLVCLSDLWGLGGAQKECISLCKLVSSSGICLGMLGLSMWTETFQVVKNPAYSVVDFCGSFL